MLLDDIALVDVVCWQPQANSKCMCKNHSLKEVLKMY